MDIDNYYKNTSTNERKVYYEIEQISGLKYYNNLLKVIYFLLLAQLLFSGYIFNSNIKRIYSFIIIIIAISLPFILKYIVQFGFNLFNNNSASYVPSNKELSSCVLTTEEVLALAAQQPEVVDTTVKAEILVPKCYVRLEGGFCNKDRESGWTGWRQLNDFKDCYDCNNDNQQGCDAIKNKFISQCGNNAFNIYTTDELPSDNTCFSEVN